MSVCLKSVWAGKSRRACFPSSAFPEVMENETGFAREESLFGFAGMFGRTDWQRLNLVMCL